MSEKLGQVTLERDRQPFLLTPGQAPSPGDYSGETAREIDCEIRRIIDEQHARATAIVGGRQEGLREAASLLLTKETMSGDELRAILARPATARALTA